MAATAAASSSSSAPSLIINGHHTTSSDSKSEREEEDGRRARARLLASRLSESLLTRCATSSSSTTSTNTSSSHNGKGSSHSETTVNSIEHRIKSAIDVGDLKALKEIYSSPSPPPIEQKFSSSWTALVHAAYACQLDIVQYLVDVLKADVNGKVALNNLTPLMACCMSSHSKSGGTTLLGDEQVAVCEFLLERGANVEEEEASMSPLMFAARFGCSSKLIRLLVSHGARVERKDERGWSPLIMATQHGHLGSVQALVESGAQPFATTKAGISALDMARHSGHTQIAAYLNEQCKSREQEVKTTEQLPSSTVSEAKAQEEDVKKEEKVSIPPQLLLPPKDEGEEMKEKEPPDADARHQTSTSRPISPLHRRVAHPPPPLHLPRQQSSTETNTTTENRSHLFLGLTAAATAGTLLLLLYTATKRH